MTVSVAISYPVLNAMNLCSDCIFVVFNSYYLISSSISMGGEPVLCYT